MGRLSLPLISISLLTLFLRQTQHLQTPDRPEQWPSALSLLGLNCYHLSLIPALTINCMAEHFKALVDQKGWPRRSQRFVFDFAEIPRHFHLWPSLLLPLKIPRGPSQGQGELQLNSVWYLKANFWVPTRLSIQTSVKCNQVKKECVYLWHKAIIIWFGGKVNVLLWNQSEVDICFL